MTPNPKYSEEEWDTERLKYFISLSVEEKLHYLEQLNTFLHQVMPPTSQEIWQKLKQEGF